MNRDELQAHMKAGFDQCLAICAAKNSDYAGESGENPFANFEVSEMVGVPVSRGMLVRLMDKIKRASNLLDQKALVNESIDDTLLDAINYLGLLRAWLISEGVINSERS